MSWHHSFFSLLRNCPEGRVRDFTLNVPWKPGPPFFSLPMRKGCFQFTGCSSCLSRDCLNKWSWTEQPIKLGKFRFFSPWKVCHRNEARKLASTEWGLCGRHFASTLQYGVGRKIGFPVSQMRNLKLISMDLSSYHPNWSLCSSYSGIPLYSQTQKLTWHTKGAIYLSIWKYCVKLSDSKVFTPQTMSYGKYREATTLSTSLYK